MDEVWSLFDCDPLVLDDRITSFYSHPVWLLNGLFIEQDPESLFTRETFAFWVKDKSPTRIADFGGGFGSLGRYIGIALPHCSVEIVEPFPHPAAIALAERTSNVRYVSELSGEYDLLIATDVFEHVADPIALALSTASKLRRGGYFLIANCFYPVIYCHLPQLFHFSIGWHQVMSAMGLVPKERVQYGRAYLRSGNLNAISARKAALWSKRLFPLIRLLPRGKTRIGSFLINVFSKFLDW